MILKSSILRNSLYFFFSVLCLHACGLFTFSGGALRDDIKTFSIHFYTEVSDGPTDMLQKFTEALSTKILGMTCLTREEKDGDIQYEGGIKSFRYTTAFSSKNKDDDSIQEIQRLTITIEVSCLNPSDKECSFTKKQFSASADMPSTDNQLDKEPELIKEIFSKLVMDVCNKSIDNW